MLTPPINSSFRIFFPSDFVYPEVEEMFASYFRENLPIFRRTVDYLNHCATNALIPGLRDEGSGQQIYDKGKQSRTFAGSIPLQRLFDKEITVNYQIKEGWLNWIILREQFKIYKERTKENHPDRVFMKDLYLHIVDIYGNIVISVRYIGLRLTTVPSIEFNKTNNGLATDTFGMSFAYNDVEVNYVFKEKVNYTNEIYKY